MILLVLAAIGAILIVIIGRHPRPSEEEQWEIDRREQLAKISLLESRKEQIRHQTEGIIKRYRQTDENRVNAMLRQIRQEQEIELLKLKIKTLERELGKESDPFEPIDKNI